MLKVGTENISTLFVGRMGVKTAAVGAATVYQRPGAYVYIELQNTTKKETE